VGAARSRTAQNDSRFTATRRMRRSELRSATATGSPPVICHEPNEPQLGSACLHSEHVAGACERHTFFLEDGTAIFDLFAQGFTLLRFGDVGHELARARCPQARSPVTYGRYPRPQSDGTVRASPRADSSGSTCRMARAIGTPSDSSSGHRPRARGVTCTTNWNA